MEETGPATDGHEPIDVPADLEVEAAAEPAPATAAPGLDPDELRRIIAREVNRVLDESARQIFEDVARQTIPKVAEEVLTREIQALRRDLEESLD